MDWPPIAPEDLALTAVSQQPGAPAVILLHEETADDPNNNHSVYMRVKVLTEAGRKYADVEIPYSRSDFTISDVSGRTVHADGSIVPFEGKPFDKVAVRTKGSHSLRIHLKSFTLPDVQLGSILDYRYSYRYGDRVFYPPEWILQDELFQEREVFKFIPYAGDLQLEHGRIGNGIAWSAFVPKDHPPMLHNVPRTSLASARQSSEWVDLEMTNVPAVVEEPFMPPRDTLAYRVQFYYTLNSKIEDYWKEEGKYWSKEVEGFIDRHKGVAETVAQVTSASDSPEQKVRKIYAFIAGLENQSYIPYRPEQEQKVLGLKNNQGAEDVLRQRSGDHDELNRLFVSMVRAAGIPARMMRVPNRERTFFNQYLMSTHQFDGEIAIVQIAGKDVYFDPGSKYCPYGLLNWRYSGSEGLRQSATKGTEFGESTLNGYGEAMIQRLALLQLTDQGRVEGTIKVGYYGLEGMERRQLAGKTDAEGRKKLLEDEVKGWLPADAEVSLMNEPNWDTTETHLAAQFKVNSPAPVSAGKRWLVPVHLFQVNKNAVFAASERVKPIYFGYPTRKVDEVHITLPSGVEVESLPTNDSVRLDYAIYQTNQKQDASTIIARRDIVMGGMAFPVTVYKELKGFYDKVKTGDDQQALLRASAHAQAN